MNILVCSFTYPPNRDGVSAAVDFMVTGLRARGHEVAVATTFLQERIAPMTGVIQFKIEGHPRRFGRYVGEIEAFQRLLIEGKFDVIVTHCWYTWPSDLLIAVADQISARKILVSHGFGAHRVDWHNRPPWGIGSWLDRVPYCLSLAKKMRRFDSVVFLSQTRDWDRFADHTLAHLIGYQSHLSIPNAVNPKFASEQPSGFRKAHGIEESMFFLCVANYSERKNQELAIRAFHRAAIPHSVLVCIGSELGSYGRHSQRVHAELRAQGSNALVLFLERVDETATHSAFCECDVFILSAKAETQPIVLLEAMACQKPWISTNTGCVRELPGGLVVKRERGIARAMTDLSSDPGLRRRLGQEGYEASVSNFSGEKVLDQYENMFRALKT